MPRLAKAQRRARLMDRNKPRMIRVKPHPICPECGVVMKFNGHPSHSPRVTYYKCPMPWCGCTEKLIDAFRPLTDISDAQQPG